MCGQEIQRKPQLWQFASHVWVEEEILVGADRRTEEFFIRIKRGFLDYTPLDWTSKINLTLW